jgi:hypothetical protein
VPWAPGNLRVLALGPTVVRVIWTDVPNELGYRIYGGDQSVPSTTFVIGAPGNTTSQDIPGRAAGTTYCYGVSAFNPLGESPLSGPECVTTPGSTPSALTAPTNVLISQVMVGGAVGGLRLDWTDTSNGETGFQIVRGDQPLASVGANVTTYADLTWTPSLPNCYRVVAVRDLDQASSDRACATVGSTQPTPPSNLAVAPSIGRALRLDWGDTSANEDGFQILRNNLLIMTVPPNTVTFVDPNPDSGQNCYRVAAYNATGAAYSTQVCRAV